MKKWLLAVVVLLLISMNVIQHKPKVMNNQIKVENDDTQEMMKISKNQIYRGNLLLINTEHPVPPGAENTNAVKLYKNKNLVQGFQLLDNSVQLSKGMVQRLKQQNRVESIIFS